MSKIDKARLEATVTIEQKELVLKAASIQGRSLTDFVINAVTEAAITTLEQHNIMELTKKDSELFANEILDIKLPSEKLKKAAQQYKQIISE